MTETIKTVSTPEMLAAAEKRYNKANLRLLNAINNPRSNNDNDYLRAALEEAQARAQLAAIRKTQFKNVFIERNAAEGISQ